MSKVNLSGWLLTLCDVCLIAIAQCGTDYKITFIFLSVCTSTAAILTQLCTVIWGLEKYDRVCLG